ncbi:hypothetical protein [Actinomadura livida]|uniref:Uncharacterized protein YukE n=1 Tax=Actinomadura livida TaxID=79909 RepID=A0A7W7I961_9ACTN|nr:MULTISPECIES: hypothetical protein [Actinomadura]MBB4772802.1 uncharacterized protein YukE [Actinomadura catellatispora]GGU12834.1 hypothetical protein GCM10010208_42170 [Actinomadura livida]
MGKNTEQYPIRDGMAFGSHNASGMSHEDVKNKLKELKPEKVGDASTAYKEAAEALAEMTEELKNNFSKRIVQHWKGESAQKALDQLGQVYATAGTLSDDSHRNASLYAWYKHDILDWYKTQGQTMTDGWVHTGGDDDNARELMNNFIGRMKEAFEGHPLKIEKDLPSGYGGGGDDPPGGPGPGPGGPGPFGGGGGGGGKFGGAGSGFPSSDSASPFAPGAGSGSSPWNPGGGGPFDPGSGGPHLPGGGGVPGGGIPGGGGSLSGAPSSDLSSFPGGGGGGGGLPGGMPGGGGGFGADPGGFGGGAGAGSGGVGPGGVGGGGMGAAGRGAAGMRGGMPMGGMPMAPGQGGKGGEERERETWLSEDEDVWGGDDDTAPPVIG